MRLRKPCEHGRYEPHVWGPGLFFEQPGGISCPGGEFLAEDTLVIEKVDGEWPEWAYEVAGRRLEFTGGTDQWRHASYRMAYLSLVFRALESHFTDALAVREGEG